MSTIAVIGDAHFRPGVNNRRARWAAKAIYDRSCTHVVDIGDWYDMPSLSSYDKGKKSFEGRRYKADIIAGNDAYDVFEAELKRISNGRFTPAKHKLIGNHETRILRATESAAELDGTIGFEDFNYTKHGWKHHDFNVPAVIDGVAFSHYFSSGVLGKPIGGKHPAASTLDKQHQSCVSGHVHTRDFAEQTRADGKKICAAIVGCFLDKDQREAYAGESQKLWWKGLVFLHNVKEGYFDPEFVNINTLEKVYD